MLNIRLLSLLVFISIVNLYVVNAGNLKSCVQGILEIDPSTRLIKNRGTMEGECTNSNYRCFQRVEGDKNIFGCANKNDCKDLEESGQGYCCGDDNCNY